MKLTTSMTPMACSRRRRVKASIIAATIRTDGGPASDPDVARRRRSGEPLLHGDHEAQIEEVVRPLREIDAVLLAPGQCGCWCSGM